GAMTETAPGPRFGGEPQPEGFEELLLSGRAKGTISADELMSVIKDVELSEEVILGYRDLLAREGITLDEGVDLDRVAELPAGVTAEDLAVLAAQGQLTTRGSGEDDVVDDDAVDDPEVAVLDDV